MLVDTEKTKYLPKYLEKDLLILFFNGVSLPFNGRKLSFILFYILFYAKRLFFILCIMRYSQFAFVIVRSAFPDVNEVLNSLGLNTTLIVGCLKISLVHFRRSQLEDILLTLSDEIFKQNKEEHDKILQESVRRMNFFRALYYITVSLCTGFLVFPNLFSLMRHGFNEEIFIITYVVANFACAITVIDLVVVAFFSEATAQFKILLYEVENIVELAHDNFKDDRRLVDKDVTNIPNEVQLDVQFEKCIRHHLHILKFFHKVENTFPELFAAQFIAIVAVLGITVYNIALGDLDMIGIAWEFFFLSCMMQQIYIFCHMATLLKTESEKLTDAIYKSNWIVTPIRFRTKLIIMAERSKLSIDPKAAAIMPMSLDSFVKILKTSYSAYAFLSNSK